MHTNTRKWGNSAGTIIPATTLQKAGLEIVLEGAQTEEPILSYQVLSFDFRQRLATLIEKARAAIIAK